MDMDNGERKGESHLCCVPTDLDLETTISIPLTLLNDYPY